MIRPNRLRCMLRDARWVTRNAPVRLALMTSSKRSSVIRIRNASLEMPALATSTSTGPWCSSTSLNARSTASLSVTSHTTPNSPSGAPEPRWVTATLWPSAASRCAIANPIPRLPPVTRTERDTNGGFAAGVSLSVTGITYQCSGLTLRSPNSPLALCPGSCRVNGGRRLCRQPPVEQQRRQRGHRQDERAQPQPAGGRVTADGLVADLVLQGGVDLFELGQAGGGVGGAAGQVGDLLQRVVVDGHRLTLLVDLDVAVGGAERDRRDRHALVLGGARRGERSLGVVRVGRHGLLAVGEQHDARRRRGVAAADDRAHGGDRLQRGEDALPGGGPVGQLQLVDRGLGGLPVRGR